MANSFWRCPEFKNRKQVGDLQKRMNFLKQKNKSTVFNFTGCRGSEGVSTILVNLIDYMSKTKEGKKILLVDANFKKPVMHNAFDKQLGRGLSEILTGSCEWSEAVSDTGFANVHLLTCGSRYNAMEGSLDEERFAASIKEVKDMYDIVLLDAPPLLTSPDSLTVALSADTTFLVIRAMDTQKEVGERAKSLLVDNECNTAGVLLNRVKQVIPGWMYRLL